MPGGRREAGLPGDLEEESLPVEMPFRRDLRQKQAASSPRLDDQSVAPDDDLLGVFERDRGRQNGKLDLASRKFLGGEPRKTRVFEGRP